MISSVSGTASLFIMSPKNERRSVSGFAKTAQVPAILHFSCVNVASQVCTTEKPGSSRENLRSLGGSNFARNGRHHLRLNIT